VRKYKSLLEIHSAVLLFGLAGLFGKWLSFSPLIIVLGRVFFASAALALFLWFSKQNFKITPSRNYILLVILGLILAVHWICFFKSIQVSTVAVGLLSFSTYPVFTTFFEPLFFKERVIKINMFFSALCITGVFLITPKFDLNNSIYTGVLWGLFSSFTFAVITILNKKLTMSYSSLIIAFYQDFFAMVFMLPFILILHPIFNTNNILLLAILGVLCTAGAHTLFIEGMKKIKAQTASIVHSLEPVYGIIFAFLFLHEMPSQRTILGGIIILLGQALMIFKISKLKGKA